MSDAYVDDSNTERIQFDPDTCRSILADEIPGEWHWIDYAFAFDGPADLEARVRLEFNPDEETWTIEATIRGESLEARTAPRLGLHGALEAVAERVREALLKAFDKMHREVCHARRELLNWNGRNFTDPRHGDPLSKAEIINRLAVCNPAAGEDRRHVIDVALEIETGGFPSGDAALVLALDLLESTEPLDDETAARIGERLRSIGSDLEETGRQLEASA